MSDNIELKTIFLKDVSELILKHNYNVYKFNGSNLYSSEIFIATKSEAEIANKIHKVLNDAETALGSLINLKFNQFKYNGRGEFGASASFKDLLYSEIYHKSTLEQKNWFVDNVVNMNPSLDYDKIFSTLSTEDKWIHLSNYKPNNYNKGDTYKFFNHFSTIKELNPTESFEINCFGKFLKNYSHLLKKNEISELISKYIKDNISDDYFNEFPKIIQKKLQNNEQLLTTIDNIKVLKINKSSFYNLLNFQEAKNCTLKNYNNCLWDLIAILNTKENKLKLEVDNIDCSAFNSKDHYARIFIEKINNDNKINYEFLISKLIKSAGHVYENSKNELPKKISNIIDYYILGTELSTDKGNSHKKTIKV